MRKLGVYVLNLLRRIALLTRRLRGKTEDDGGKLYMHEAVAA